MTLFTNCRQDKKSSRKFASAILHNPGLIRLQTLV